MSRARLIESALGALAVLVASWPINSLLNSSGWVGPVVVLLLAQLLVGAGARYLGLRVWAALGLQLLTVLLGTLLLRLPEYLAPSEWTELPGAINELILDAENTLTTYAVPAPLSPGLLFVLTVSLPLIGVVVDTLTAGLRMPAAAGVPLLAIFLFSTSNTGESLNPVYFLTLGALWLGMLLQQSLRSLGGWASTEAYARTPERAEDRLGLGAYSATARWVGLVTLIVAIALPVVIPHFPARYFADGLARRTDGQSASVGFTDTLDLSRDLNDRNQTPILTYATTDIAPPPLKVLTMSSYVNGTWIREDPQASITGRDNEPLPDPEGLSSRTSRRLERINVVGNGLAVPYLASPWPVASATLRGTDWYYDPDSALPRVQGTAREYSITYKSVAPAARPTGTDIPEELPPRTRNVDDSSQSLVQAAVQEATNGAGDRPFDRAIAIQDWLRDPARFTYSLQLAPTRTGADGQPLDPLSNFLATRRGYCTQFATAMVMMARSVGIPARMAVGFLPGTRTSTAGFQVRAADAHAWPELYFEGLGWTRFEPTPSVRSGEVPAYTLPQSSGTSSSATQNQQEVDESSAGSTASAATSTAAPTTTAATAPPTSEDSVTIPTWLRWALLVLILGGLVLTIVPFAARRQRTDQLRAAESANEQIEAEWMALESRLRDLGIDGPGEHSPRQLEDFYRRRAPLEAGGKEALHRATQLLEDARYGAPAERGVRTLAPEAEVIVSEVREQASLPARVSAKTFPRSGRSALAGAARRALRVPGRWLGRLRR